MTRTGVFLQFRIQVLLKTLQRLGECWRGQLHRLRGYHKMEMLPETQSVLQVTALHHSDSLYMTR